MQGMLCALVIFAYLQYSIGLTKTGAIRGAQAKWIELYEQYYEKHFERVNKEVHCLCKSYIVSLRLRT